jgi:RecB family exonuclease
MTHVFPTSRCIREFYASFLNQNQLLPKALSIAEFESMSVIVPDYTMIDEDSRVLLLKEASKFENFSKLKIEREFLVFLKNSTFLFRFFDELFANMVDLDELNSADTYADFSEHIEILSELLKRYKKLLDEQKLYDRINLREVYKLNEEFLKSHDGFLIHLEGFLNRFELELFEKIAKIKPLKISLKIDRFSKKLISIFSDFDLEEGFFYTLDLSNKKIEKKVKISKSNTEIEIKNFSNRVIQASFVYESIAKFINKGIEPQNIVVITPDESFVKILKQFDSYKNLNFAMGESFCNNEIYKKLSSVDKYLRTDELEHQYRLSRFKIDKNLINSIKMSWQSKLEVEEIIKILSTFDCNKDEIFQKELYDFKILLQKIEKLETKDAFKLFLNRLAKKSIDDTNGGKVTVMGLLESRGVSFDGVIIVDFSDDFVPKKSNKDMFLNSNLRSKVGLPSQKDRQDLQRYYYNSLIQNAKMVAISYVKNEQSMGSRFLDELGLKNETKVDENSYMKLLFSSKTPKKPYVKEWIEKPTKIKILSASKLKTLLTCKRKYYFRYILQTKEAKFPNQNLTSQDMGNLLHEGLKVVFKELKFVNEELILSGLREYLMQKCKDVSDRYLVDVWLKKLENFAKNEVKRFKEGYKVFKVEKPLHVEYEGFKLEGIIDRIDIKNDKLSIIDYKSGSIPKTTIKNLDKQSDFQLEFYSLLTKDLGEIEALYYYDLSNGSLIANDNLKERLKRLDEILKSLKEPINGYELCEDVSNCRYCAYVKMCGRVK